MRPSHSKARIRSLEVDDVVEPPQRTSKQVPCQAFRHGARIPLQPAV